MKNPSRQQRNKQSDEQRSSITSIVLQRILVPVDFSYHSKKALRYAIPFAQKFNSAIHLLYVVEPAVYPADFSFGQVGFPAVEEELRKRAEKELASLIKKEFPQKNKAQGDIRVGKPFYEIARYAREEKIDLIIIATHGHSGIEHALFGSTAEKVVRKSPCPVLVVHTAERDFVK